MFAFAGAGSLAPAASGPESPQSVPVSSKSDLRPASRPHDGRANARSGALGGLQSATFEYFDYLVDFCAYGVGNQRDREEP